MAVDVRMYDLSVSNSALDSDESLKTAITVSLLSWARAQPGDVVPDAEDLKGVWFDTYASVPGDRFGSRLWTLIGQPINSRLLAQFDELVREALQWMIDDGIIQDLQIVIEVVGPEMVGAKVGVRRPRDTSLTWLDTWQVNLGSI
jgi:phage gp46-like protein